MPTLLRTLRRDRGAGLVEYALGVAFVALLLTTVIDRFQDSESSHLADSGDRIGMPDLDQTYGGSTPPTTTSGGGGGDGSGSTTEVALGPGTTTTATLEGSKWRATVDVAAVSDGQPLAGVVVTGSWTPAANGNKQSTSCTTDADGRCPVSRWDLGTQGGNAVPVATFTITGISGPDYAPGAGVVGTTFEILAPGTTPPTSDTTLP